MPAVEFIAKMFDSIAPTYDGLNRFLSFGIDQYWRHKMVREIHPKGSVLDVATGTADVLLAIAKRYPSRYGLIGIDISRRMLDLGRQKITDFNLTDQIKLQMGDATQLPFSDESIESVTMAFGLRNTESISKTISEIFRVLSPGGRVVILEFSLPKSRPIRWIYLGYFRWILPIIGGFVSGQFRAYRYLNQSVEQFPSVDAISEIFQTTGFHVVTHPLTAGIATMYIGTKPH